MTIVSLSLLFACGANPTQSDQDLPQVEETDDDGTPRWSAAGEVSLTTRDGVTLAADWYPSATEGQPVVVLLHMTPAGPWNRTDWPVEFIETLNAHDWSVLAVDRRGAGESGGEGKDAYDGEAGRYDVEACVKYAADEGAGAVGLIGASNGTTSMIDYAAWSGGEGLPEAVALAYLSGGTYTENQTAMADVPQIPMFFGYPTSERSWPENQKGLDPGSWQFHEYDGSAHGTKLFADGTTVAADLDAFFASAWAK